MLSLVLVPLPLGNVRLAQDLESLCPGSQSQSFLANPLFLPCRRTWSNSTRGVPHRFTG